MEELAWFAEGDDVLLGVVGRDTSDNDYVAIALARDARMRFRAVDLQHSVSTPAAAAIWLRERLAALAQLRAEAHYQGDETGAPVDFFEPIVALEDRSRAFEQLRTQPQYSPALGLLRELMRYYEDADGNFVQQFQSTGFDSRLWETYLYAAFVEAGYALDRKHPVPDFHCLGPLGDFFVEATTIGVSPTPVEITDSNEESYFTDYIPIRFGSVLWDKLKKRYWERPHVAGHPLVLAVQDFHLPGSMKWSGSSLVEYLYGLRQSERDGMVITDPVTSHSWGTKTIPSNFFSLPDAEHISAVIANPSGTLSKFTRMGFLTGFGDRELRIVRRGIAFQGDDATFPTPFVREVSASDYQESWCEGLAVYHNPQAKIPLPEEALPQAGHFKVLAGELLSLRPPFFPLGSETWTVVPHEGGETELGAADGSLDRPPETEANK